MSILIKLFFLVFILTLGSLEVYYLCKINKIKFTILNYVDSIRSIVKVLSNGSVKNINDLKIKLDKISITGAKLILNIFIFLIPYFFTFTMLIISKLFSSLELLVLFSTAPYLILIKKNK